MPNIVFNPTWHTARQYEIFHCGIRFVILPGGRRSGKTTGAMTHAAEQLLSREKIKILWVDTTQGNIEKYVTEIMLPMLPVGSYKWNKQQKVLTMFNGSVMHFGSAQVPENLEGFGYQIIYLNEAGIILKGSSGEKLWNNTIRPMTIEEHNGQRCQVFMVGTPKGAGLFRDFAERAEAGDPDWRVFALSTYDNPLIPKAEIDQLVKDSPGKIARQEIFGEFIDSDEDDPVIPSEWILSALERENPDMLKDYVVVWGVDVARSGHDRSVLVQRRHRKLIAPVMSWNAMDTFQLAEKLKEIYLETSEGNRPREIMIDTIGIGSGVYDIGRRLSLPVRDVNVSRKPLSEKFPQLKDELWWKARAWMETGSILNEHALAQELMRPVVDKKTLEEKGKWKVESKAKMEGRLGTIDGRSPDLADALILTFAAGIERLRDRGQPNDYGRNKRRDNFSFMAA